MNLQATCTNKLARARGGVRPHWGITVIPAPRAAPAPVMSPGGDGVDPVKTPR